MRLWVDDFRPAPKGWVWARTVTEAIRKIVESPLILSEVSLDHDIMDSNETFEPVAYFIKYYCCDECISPIINIHTANPVAAAKMVSILAGYSSGLITEKDYVQMYADN